LQTRARGTRRRTEALAPRCPGIALEINRERSPASGKMDTTEEAIFPSQNRKSPTTSLTAANQNGL
ncbi:MAG: hypothetical protein FWD55_06835, partial [Propionibacteriaceae bacterium]|nr:hypothetical protein [Propionibacteriaceae bacterium]